MASAPFIPFSPSMTSKGIGSLVLAKLRLSAASVGSKALKYSNASRITPVANNPGRTCVFLPLGISKGRRRMTAKRARERRARDHSPIQAQWDCSQNENAKARELCRSFPKHRRRQGWAHQGGRAF